MRSTSIWNINPACAISVVVSTRALRYRGTVGARQCTPGGVLTPHLDLAGHQQRAVFYRRGFRRPVWIFVRPAIEPVVQQRSARASARDLGHLVGAGGVRQDPRSPVELEDFALPTQALGDVDAEVQVKADLDIPPPVYLPHPVKHTCIYDELGWPSHRCRAKEDAHGRTARPPCATTTTTNGESLLTTTITSSRC